MKCDKTTQRAFVVWKKRKFYFGKYGSPDAAQKFAKWLADAYSNTTAPAPKSHIRVVDCVNLYLKHAEEYYSVDGVKTQEFRNVHAAMQTLIWHAGTCLAADFGPRKLTEIQQAMVNEVVEERRVYARTTINARIHRIRRCFRWCASMEYISADIVTGLEMIPGLSKGRTAAREAEPVTSVPISTVKATLPFVSPIVSTMFRVQLLCGMRPQDVCQMTTGAIDRSGDIWLYRPEHHKMSYAGRMLVKAIPPAAQELLKPLLRSSPTEPIFSPQDSLQYWRSMERKRVPKRAKESKPKPRMPYSTASYGKAVVYAISRAAKHGVTIPHWTTNQLRHSIASQLRGTSGIEAAQLFLGHSKPDTTLIYAETSVETLSAIARQLTSPFDEPKMERE